MNRNLLYLRLIFVTSMLFSFRFPSCAGNPTTTNSVHTVRNFNHSRIVGGDFARIDLFPYVVQLRYGSVTGRIFCTGSIIAKRKILTAAQCQARTGDVVVYGREKLDAGGMAISIATVSRHPYYNHKTLENDVAVLTLKEDIIYGYTARAIPLATGVPYLPAAVYISGWGRTMNGDPAKTQPPPQLKKIYAQIFYSTDCEKLVPKKGLPFNPDHMFCTYKDIDQGTCVGDSGAPVVYRYTNKKEQTGVVALGVVSYGYPCALGYADIHTIVAAYRDWILKQ